MRKLILSLVVAAGVLGIIGFTPAKANAYWIRTPYGMMNYNAYGPYANFYMSGYPMYNPFYSVGSYYGRAYTYPASYRYSAAYNGVMSMYATRSMAAYLYHPVLGYSYRFVTPAYSGYTISPYVGYKTFSVPSATYTIPLGYPASTGWYANPYYYGAYINPYAAASYYSYYPY